MNLLHVGAGRTELPEWLRTHRETRLDIDPQMAPDVVASMTDMGEIGRYGVIYTSHALEHLDPDGVRQALAEFLRVLEPGGAAIVVVPDTEGIEDTDEVLYESPAGPITGHDILHGPTRFIPDNPFMAHHSRFTTETLAEAMREAGFAAIQTGRYPAYNLMAVAQKEAA